MQGKFKNFICNILKTLHLFNICKSIFYFFKKVTFEYPYKIDICHFYDIICLPEKLNFSSISNHNTLFYKNNYNILLCTSSLSPGGAERQWCYLALELSMRGYPVTLLVDNLEGSCGHYLPLLQNSTVRIVDIHHCKLSASDILSYEFLNIPYEIFKYIIAISNIRPSHILCQLDHPNVLCGTASLFFGNSIKKILLSFRNVNPSHFSYIYTPWLLPLYKCIIKSKNVVLNANSQVGGDDYAQWLDIPSERVLLARNAVKPVLETPNTRERIRRDLGIDDHSPVVLGVMRLSEEKNPQLFVRVAARIVREMPQAHIVLVGAGPLNGAVAKAVHDYGIDKYFSLLPSRQDVPNLMRAADVFLLTSDWEGMPNVLLESQTLGVPVVATRVGGVPEAVMDGESGLLAPKGDEDALVVHLLRLLRDPDERERMGRAGRVFVAENFSVEALCDTICRQADLPSRPDRPCTLPPPPLPEYKDSVSANEALHIVSLRKLLVGGTAATCRPLIVFAHFPLPEFIVATLPNRSLCLMLPGIALPQGYAAREIDWRTPDSWKQLEGTLPSGAAALIFEHWPGWKHLDRRFLRLGISWAICNNGEHWFLFPLTHIPLLRDLRGLFRTMKAFVSERLLRSKH